MRLYTHFYSKDVQMKHALISLLAIPLSSQALADTWTVNANGKADFATIQEAIDVSSSGDEILVMPGVYTGSGNEVVNMLGKEIWLHSSEGSSVTIIDGEGTRGCVMCENDETINTHIEGFTFTRGNTYSGGGVFLFYASATVTSCNFINNTQSSMGSAICCLSGELHVSNSSFSNNESWWAGSAVYAGGGPIILESCSFSQNTTSRGGAVYIASAETFISNCVFDANNGSGDYQLGGALYLEHASGTLDSCSFTNNNAKYGGAIYNDNSTMAYENLHIQNNEATLLGGGIETFGPFPQISNSTICGNLSDQIHGGWTDSGGNLVEDECAPPCTSDLNGDGAVTVIDLLDLISAWGQTKSPADINTDGVVDVSDLLELVGNWGECELQV